MAAMVSMHTHLAGGFADLDPSVNGYDAIHVGAAADGMPTKLCAMLKPGGLMLVPTGKVHETQVCDLGSTAVIAITVGPALMDRVSYLRLCYLSQLGCLQAAPRSGLQGRGRVSRAASGQPPLCSP